MTQTFEDPTAFPILFDPTVQRMMGRSVHGNVFFDVPFISNIKDNLWQGGCERGLVLPEYIKHVVSLYKWERYEVEHELASFMEVRMLDSKEDGIDLDQVVAIAEWVNVCRKSHPTLVHCQAGLNRSSLIACTALIINGEMDPQQAVDWIRAERSPACLCNPLFEQFVLSLDSPSF